MNYCDWPGETGPLCINKCTILDTLHPLGSEVADPRTCSYRSCSSQETWPQAVWLTKKEVEGCDCCLLANGTMVADGASWWDNSVRPPLMLECCRGQILTPATSQTSQTPANTTTTPSCDSGDYGGGEAGRRSELIFSKFRNIADWRSAWRGQE